MRTVAAVAALAISLAGFRLLAQEPAGNRAYRGGDYERASELYREALRDGDANPRLRYNLGTTLLRLEEAESALDHLTRSLDARSPDLRARAFYNLGNAHAAPADRPASAEDLRQAIDAYRRSLLLEPGRADARWNLELARQRLEEMESRPPSGAQGPERESDSGAGGDAPTRPDEPGGASPVPGSDEGDQGTALEPGAEAPLPRALAEQILRAVEEQERSLQREKLRRSKRRVSGPDW